MQTAILFAHWDLVQQHILDGLDNFLMLYTCMYTVYLHTLCAENVDYEVVSHSVTLTPTTPEACVAIIIMDDKAVELNENLRVSLSQVGKLDGVQIPKDPATVSIQDDDST